jgi:hypothetical protein
MLCAVHLAAQIPNGGFEDWTSGNPDYWLTNNAPGFAVPLTQETPSHSGTYAIRGEVVNSPGGAIAPLLAANDSFGNGFPITQAHGSLSFYYKLNTTNTAMIVSIGISDTGGVPIGAGGLVLDGTVSSFTSITIPIYYINTDNAAHAYITVMLADTQSGTPNVGDYFVMDDVTFTGFVGVPMSIASRARVYPNPASETVTVAVEGGGTGDALLLLYDIDGRFLRSMAAEVPGKFEWQLPVADLPQGIYNVLVLGETQDWQTRLIRQ